MTASRAPATRRRDTAERIPREAMRLFARNGYGATTVAEIEHAVGLSPGAGGMYRHYPSKEAVLRAAVDRYAMQFAERLSAFASHLVAVSTSDMRVQLQLMAESTLEDTPEQRDLLRVLFRETDTVPDVLTEVRDRFLSLGYQGFAAWLRAHGVAGEADAMAAVFFGALINFWASGVLLGEAPGRVDRDRFVDVWCDAVLAVVEKREPRGRKRAKR